MPAYLYHPIYFILVTLLCLFVAGRYMSSPDFRLQISVNNNILPLIICIFFILLLGTRPINGQYFGDTVNYAMEYSRLDSMKGIEANWGSEWIWDALMTTCKFTGLSITMFFTIVEAGYLLFAYAAIKKFLPSNSFIGLLFMLSSLMFYNFGVNGLRNGLACSITFLAIAYFLEKKYIPAIIFALMAFGTHRSVALPILGILLACYLIKDYRSSVYIWLGCIVLSLTTGNFFVNVFSLLGFDERMSSYLTSEYENQFASSGFRWDFLIYSLPPIYLAWYILIKLKIKDDWYRVLSITYCIANAFWVLVIRMAFSNRFAYLSWFLYPILIAYPIINLPIWKDQDKKIGLCLLIYCSFTFFMQMLVW